MSDNQGAYRAILCAITLERFAWYLLLGALALWRDSSAVGALLFWGYLAPILGGIAGRYSLRGSVLAGAMLLLCGYVAAMTNHSPLPILALGCGLFKPCLSAMLGGLFAGEARSKAYGRFYAAIQVGSMPSTLVGGYLRYRYGWPAAFGAAALALVLCVGVLLYNWRSFANSAQSIAGDALDAIAEHAPQWGKLAAICAGAVAFFAGFQQQQTSLVLWAQNVCRVELPESVSTLNPVFAAALLATPLAAWQNLRGRLTAAMLSLAAAFALLLFGGSSIAWLVGWYALATVGEVLVSPLGLEMAASLVPRRHRAVATAMWLGAMAIGGKLAGALGSAEPRVAVLVSMLLSISGAVWFWTQIEPSKPVESTSRCADMQALKHRINT
jgi:POT family proton-dependent oligopeptide transporter